jgi:hypothetical protein
MNQTFSQPENGANDPKPNPAVKVALTALFMIVTWWIWKPLGAYLTILAVGGYGTRRISTSCVLLGPNGSFTLGVMWGVIMAAVVCLTATIGVSAWWAKVLLEFWGLIAVGYIGSPPHFSQNHLILVSKNQLQFIGGSGIISYLLASGLIWFALWLHH